MRKLNFNDLYVTSWAKLFKTPTPPIKQGWEKKKSSVRERNWSTIAMEEIDCSRIIEFLLLPQDAFKQTKISKTLSCL